jgi:hypothetical protein
VSLLRGLAAAREFLLGGRPLTAQRRKELDDV